MATGQRKASWTRLPDESWGVLVVGPQADKFAGKAVPVASRTRGEQMVELHEVVQSWENGRKCTYTKKPRGNGAPPLKPRGKVEITSEQIRELLENKPVTIKGVTIKWVSG